MRDDAHPSTRASLLGRLGVDPRNATAWDEFVRRYGGEIFRWCRKWRLQEADADDVTQDVLLRVARQMERFRYDPGQSFRGWLRTLTHAAWCDWLEGQKRQNQGSGDSQVLQALATVEARDDLVRKLEDEYDLELLEAATVRVRLRVEPKTWEAFRLQAYEGLSGAEAAKALGMKLGLVFVAKSRVQKMLQATIESLDPGEAKV